MKIHELIEELQKFNKDTYILFGRPNTGYWDVEEIKGIIFRDSDNQPDVLKDCIILTLWEE